MSLELYIAFVLAATVLILAPGPNLATIVANSLAHGPRFGLLTVAGTSSAMALQLALVVLGTSTALTFMADWFSILRWIGVAYLVWLGVAAWRAAPADLSAPRAQEASPRAVWLRGFAVSLSNPKTLLFFGAFLPQFATPGEGMTAQLALLALTFLVLATMLDSLWAIFAGRLVRLLRIEGRWRNRMTGGFLIGAGLGLALARRP